MAGLLGGPAGARRARTPARTRSETAAHVRANVEASRRARAASGFGGRALAAGNRSALTPTQQARVARKQADGRERATPRASARRSREVWTRRDDHPYSAQGRSPDRAKSRVAEDGSLRPADPDGSATIQDHVRGSEPRKSQSPYTSLSDDGRVAGKNYGDRRVEVDVGRLRRDIDSGRVRGVELTDHDQLLAHHDRYIRAAQARYDANPTPKNQKSLERALRDRTNSARDREVLIRGVIPPEYVTVTPP